MLGVGTISPLCVTKTTINLPIYFIHPQLQLNYAPLTLLRRSGFCLLAQKKQQNSSFSKIELESEDFDDGFGEDEAGYDELDEDLFDEVDDEGDDDEDDEVMVPLDKMDAWLEKKPKGFGEGKVYDTSVEDKLLVELEKIREAQVANIGKLKNQAKVGEPKKEVKVSEITPGCVRVRINNLPKKKNIQRDLKSAFKGAPGIANILPMVSGTKKTRDPVCKGFAFVDFKSLEDANRFIQLFSGQNISFGKTEKRIKCELLKLGDDGNVGSVREPRSIVSKSRISLLEEERNGVDDVGEHIPQLDSLEEDDFDDLDEDEDDEDVVVNFELLKSMKRGDIGSIESRLLKQSFDPLPTKQKVKEAGKKTSEVKKKPDNNISKPKITAFRKTEDRFLDIGEHDPQIIDSLEDDDFDDLDEDEDDEDFVVDLELLNSMERGDIGSIEARLLKQSFDPLPTQHKEKASKKMAAVKKKPDSEFDELVKDEHNVDIVENVEPLASTKQTFDPLLTKQKQKRVNKKKPAVKKKPDSATKIKLPGSSKRLKVNEKAKLADVYSKYAAREAAMASKEM